MSDLYHWYKKHKICVVCRKNDAEGNYTTCLACRMAMREKGDTHSEQAKAKNKERLKRRRDLLYAFGVCVQCGKHDAKKGSTSCEYCLARSRKCSEKARRRRGIYARDGYTKSELCYFCNEPVVGGKKTCKKHYSQLRSQMLYARSCKKEGNYFEKLNNAFWSEHNGNVEIRNKGRQGE